MLDLSRIAQLLAHLQVSERMSTEKTYDSRALPNVARLDAVTATILKRSSSKESGSLPDNLVACRAEKCVQNTVQYSPLQPVQDGKPTWYGVPTIPRQMHLINSVFSHKRNHPETIGCASRWQTSWALRCLLVSSVRSILLAFCSMLTPGCETHNPNVEYTTGYSFTCLRSCFDQRRQYRPQELRWCATPVSKNAAVRG